MYWGIREEINQLILEKSIWLAKPQMKMSAYKFSKFFFCKVMG